MEFKDEEERFYCFSFASVWRRVPQGTEYCLGGGWEREGELIPKSCTRHRTVRQCINYLLYIE